MTLASVKKITLSAGNVAASVQINRPDKANALSVEMMRELTEVFTDLKNWARLRFVVLSGAGKHFSAGADLNWMKAAAQMNEAENLVDSQYLVRLFNSYLEIPAPKIAKVQGACYGGAVGLVATSDFVLCDPNAKFCLSEVKLGLLPAVIYPFLLRRMSPSQTKKLALTAQVFGGEDAIINGLADQVVNDIAKEAQPLINQILSGGPEAQRRLLDLHETLTQNSIDDVHLVTSKAISAARMGVEGQKGLNAFFAKEPSPWSISVSDEQMKEIFSE